MSDKTYMTPYMRRQRTWTKEEQVIMRLSPEKRVMACMALFSRDFDDILRKGGKRHHALLRRIREAPDAVPDFQIVKPTR